MCRKENMHCKAKDEALPLTASKSVQSSAMWWALYGCVNSPPRPEGPGGEITQPRARLIADISLYIRNLRLATHISISA